MKDAVTVNVKEDETRKVLPPHLKALHNAYTEVYGRVLVPPYSDFEEIYEKWNGKGNSAVDERISMLHELRMREMERERAIMIDTVNRNAIAEKAAQLAYTEMNANVEFHGADQVYKDSAFRDLYNTIKHLLSGSYPTPGNVE